MIAILFRLLMIILLFPSCDWEASDNGNKPKKVLDDIEQSRNNSTDTNEASYADCIAGKSCVTGFIRHGLDITIYPIDSKYSAYEFHDASDFGDRFDTAFIKPYIESKAEIEQLSFDDFDIEYLPTVTRTNFAEGFEIFIEGNIAYNKTVMTGEGNFTVPNIENKDRLLQFKATKEITLKVKNNTTGVTKYQCLIFENKQTDIEPDEDSPFVMLLGAVKVFTYRYQEAAGPCHGQSVTDDGLTNTLNKNPHISIEKVIEIPNPLLENEDGINQNLSVSYDPESKSFFVVKGLVRNIDDGSEHRRTIQIPWDSDTTTNRTPIDSTVFTNWIPSHAVAFGGKIYSAGNFSPWAIVSYELDGTYINHFEPSLDFDLYNSDDPALRLYTYKLSSTTLKALAYIKKSNRFASAHCDIDLNDPAVLVNCKEAPDSNPEDAAQVSPNAAKGFGILGESIYLVNYSKSTGNYSIHEFNSSLVFQREFGINNLELPKSDLEKGILTSDESQLIFATQNDNMLVFRVLKLVITN